MALTAEPGELGEVPERQLRTLRRMGIDSSDRPTPQDELRALLAGTDLVLDALVRYSLRGAPP